MRWAPRTLFGRNLLLIGLLILVANLASAALFRELVMKPRVRGLADTTLRHFEALAQGLRPLPPAERRAFVERFNAQTRSPGDLRDPPRRRLNVLERAFVARINERLGGDPPMQWQREPDGSLALRLQIEGEHYWMNVPGLIPGPDLSAAWMVSSLATALLAVLGAGLIARRINRPLLALVQAAQQLGRGEATTRLSEEGPSEIATVAHRFNEMVQSLAQQEEERRLMLAGLSHDLRTPLAKMRLATEMMRGDPDLVASLERGIDTLDRLLSQFLDYTRTGQGGPWERETAVATDLNALARESALQVAGGPLILQLDATQPAWLRPQASLRLVLNLLVNAQRHGAAPFELATGDGAQGPWLEVRDRGPGIAPALAGALKQPFARGDEARGASGGAGLGLAIADRVAQADGARFELLPREGGGLVARVCWPSAAR